MNQIITGLGDEYLGKDCSESPEGKALLQDYISVLNSKSAEENLVYKIA